MNHADEIAILRKGEIVDEMPADRIASKADLAMKMVGREVVLQVDKQPVEPRQIVLDIEGLNGSGLENVDLKLRQGEILGIVGVAGNGQKALVEIACGLRKPEEGSIRILEKTGTNSTEPPGGRAISSTSPKTGGGWPSASTWIWWRISCSLLVADSSRDRGFCKKRRGKKRAP